MSLKCWGMGFRKGNIEDYFTLLAFVLGWHFVVLEYQFCYFSGHEVVELDLGGAKKHFALIYKSLLLILTLVLRLRLIFFRIILVVLHGNMQIGSSPNLKPITK